MAFGASKDRYTEGVSIYVFDRILLNSIVVYLATVDLEELSSIILFLYPLLLIKNF